MTNCNQVSTPMNPGQNFDFEKKSKNKSEFKSMVGSLIYLSTVSRPYIASVFCQDL